MAFKLKDPSRRQKTQDDKSWCPLLKVHTYDDIAIERGHSAAKVAMYLRAQAKNVTDLAGRTGWRDREVCMPIALRLDTELFSMLITALGLIRKPSELEALRPVHRVAVKELHTYNGRPALSRAARDALDVYTNGKAHWYETVKRLSGVLTVYGVTVWHVNTVDAYAISRYEALQKQYSRINYRRRVLDIDDEKSINSL